MQQRSTEQGSTVDSRRRFWQTPKCQSLNVSSLV